MINQVKLESGKVLYLKGESSREVKLTHDEYSLVSGEEENGKITKVNVDEWSVEVGQIIQLKLPIGKEQTSFKINHIKRTGPASYSLLSTVLTKADRWILPMIRDKNQTKTSMKHNTHFVNCYVGTKDEGYSNTIDLVYRYHGEVGYAKFEEGLKAHKQFREVKDLDRSHVMYRFDMTPEQIKIFELFKEGKYSKFPENYKKQVMSFSINPAEFPTKEKREGTVTYGTMYKTEKQKGKIEELVGQSISKDEEYFSIPKESEELYTGDIEVPDKQLK